MLRPRRLGLGLRAAQVLVVGVDIVFAHLGEPGYVLSLAPVAAILIGLAIADLQHETAQVVNTLRARNWRVPPASATFRFLV